MNVLIVDYGMSNLGSIKRSLEECGATVNISDNPEDLCTATKVILPGVGAFSDGMKNLHKNGWVTPIKNEIKNKNISLLGICLGMQLLADKSYEGGEFEGLGLIHGKVKKLTPLNNKERIPHIGWNEVYKVKSSPLLSNIPNGSDYYFVHSYHFIVDNPDHIIANTPYCDKFSSIIQRDNVIGTQFHPEKSQINGFQILKNFLAL